MSPCLFNLYAEYIMRSAGLEEAQEYTIANGIPDGNVLGFDPYRVNTYDDDELREKAAFARLKVHSLEEIEGDDEAMAVYNQFMHELPMVSTYSEDGETKHGVEYYLPKQLYQQDIHHQAVAADIMSKFDRLSKNRKFHAMLAMISHVNSA